MAADSDALTIARKLRYDLTACQAKLTDLTNIIAALNLEPDGRHECGRCGITFRSGRRLVEHTYTSHGGPVPEHWLATEEGAS